MAKKIIVQFEDDITGEPLEDQTMQTVQFSVNGTNYEFDAGPKSVAKFEKAIGPFIEASRKVAKTGRRSTGTAKVPSAETKLRNKAIRDWATQQGIEVPPRGRIPVAVVEKFDAAH